MRYEKKAQQRNFQVDKGYYSEEELVTMENNKIIWDLDRECGISRELRPSERNYRINVSDVHSVEIVLDEGRCYTNQAILKNGHKIYITL